jgi:hypothetical protein
MNAEVYQEKMDKLHRGYLCQMLGVELLPVEVLQHYKKVKMLIDRIDGHLTPGDMAMIIISAENSPEVAVELADEPIEESEDVVIEDALTPLGEQLEKEEAEKYATPVEVPSMTGAEAEAAVMSGAAKPVGEAVLWSPGMTVNVLTDGELKQGKIVGISRPSKVGEQVGARLKLTVEFDGGDTETFDEDEVEAV